jgi:Ca2+-binding RTX toxin-like protein
VRFRHGGAHGVHLDLVRGRATGQGHDTIVAGRGLSVVGSDQDDVILGTDSSEVYNARGGNDIVRTRGGDDRLLEGESANGDDLYDAGSGEDLVVTFRGHDTVLGGADRDQLILENPAAMTVDGGDGGDEISRYAVPSGQTVNGGAGIDSLNIILHDSPGPQAELDIPAGTITVDGISSDVSAFESWNVVSFRPLLVHGSDAGESVRANGWGGTTVAPLTAFMGGGDDTVEGGASDDFVDGGAGTDTAQLDAGANTCVDVELGDC